VNQSHTNIEIICLNDGSTDDSLPIMQEYAKSDRRIILIDKENEGYGATCNRGLNKASGTYIAIVEPDDWIELSMFEDMLAFAESFSIPIDMIKTPYWRIRMPDTPKQHRLNCTYRYRVRPKAQPFKIEEAAHLLCHHPSIWSALYRRGFLNDAGIRFKPIPGAGWADNPFLVETCCQAQTIVYLDKPYYCYREETPEKSATFARTNTLIPFRRWNEQMDIIERLHVASENVLRAQNSRGFTYLTGITAEVPLETPALYSEVELMFSRMNAELVLNDPEIAPRDKRLFLKICKMPPRKIKRLPYLISLVKQGLYSLRNVGVKFTFLSVIDFMRRMHTYRYTSYR
jgi:hypothetical protein